MTTEDLRKMSETGIDTETLQFLKESQQYMNFMVSKFRLYEPPVNPNRLKDVKGEMSFEEKRKMLSAKFPNMSSPGTRERARQILLEIGKYGNLNGNSILTTDTKSKSRKFGDEVMSSSRTSFADSLTSWSWSLKEDDISDNSIEMARKYTETSDHSVDGEIIGRKWNFGSELSDPTTNSQNSTTFDAAYANTTQSLSTIDRLQSFPLETISVSDSKSTSTVR